MKDCIGVTGYDGFIGLNLVNKLTAEGCDLKLFKGDLLKEKEVEEFVKGCSQIIHLAGVFSNNFDELLKINVIGTKNLVDSCVQHDVKRTIFFSSGAVYGDTDKLSLETDVLKPKTAYGLSKLYAEEYIKYSGIKYVILRLPNIYGPKNTKGAIYSFLSSIKKNKKAIIFGGGEQKRDFVYVEDVIGAVIKVIDSECVNEAFNIGSGQIYNLNEVVNIIKEILDISFEIEHLPPEEHNLLKELKLDISKAKGMLNWEPKYGLDSGIKNYLKVENILSDS